MLPRWKLKNTPIRLRNCEIIINYQFLIQRHVLDINLMVFDLADIDLCFLPYHTLCSKER
jgi:hypothetical protein